MRILTYSKAGYQLALRIGKSLEVEIYSKEKEKFSSREVVKEAFEKKVPLVFISATGIAVRTIAPFLRGKEWDPPVLVMDDQGKYVLSLLSGHLGGANALALDLEKITGAKAIITTATDNRGYEGLDLYARRMGFAYESIHDLTPITGAMVDKKKIFVYNPWNFPLAKYPYFTENPEEETDYCLAITEKGKLDLAYKKMAYLRPKILHLGLGCRKGASYSLLKSFLRDSLEKYNLSPKSIQDLGSISIKKEEPAFLELKKDLACPFYFFSAEDLAPFEDQVTGSDFVKKTVGVSSVSATAALKLGGQLIVDKERRDGFTLSISVH